MTEPLRSLQGVVVSGHGVASGHSTDSPYPSGTIEIQRPFFAAAGINLEDCWLGTINVCFAPLEVRLTNPDHCIEELCWTDLHPPETFSFWRIKVRHGHSVPVQGWIYKPHPETKQRHWQSETTVELLAPYMKGISPGERLDILDPKCRVQLIDHRRLRAELLEFLKFRVLASQEHFFSESTSFQKRQWLNNVYPAFLCLSDLDLESVWEQARELYLES